MFFGQDYSRDQFRFIYVHNKYFRDAFWSSSIFLFSSKKKGLKGQTGIEMKRIAC